MPELPQISNPLEFFLINGRAIGPQLHLILWGLGLLCIDFLIPREKSRVGAFFAVGGILMSSLHLYRLWGERLASAFYGMITLDAFALFFSMLFLAAAFLSVLMSYRYLEVEEERATEYYALILFATSGMMFMAGAIDLISLFIGLELMSISTYILVGFMRRSRRSNEASLKYFLLGAFSSGVILYGMSLLYGLGGSTNLDEIALQVAGLQDNSLVSLALFMMMAGLCFKVAAVPFHMWVPDAYEGAPTSITAFMSVAVKAAAFAIFLRIFFVAFAELRETYTFVLAVIAMITISWGNLAAIKQQNIKRLLAYSSIAHAGFVLMGLVVGTEFGVMAASMYLLVYTFMNLGAWAIVILLRRQDISGERVEDFNGLFFKHPAVAVLMLVFFLSLAGIPPLGGFIAKYFVFAAVLDVVFAEAGPHTSVLVWMAVVAALNVVVSVYYYFRIVVAMFVKEDYLPAPLSFSGGLMVVLVITGLLTVWIGIYPQPFIDLARAASASLI
ncbi:MAG: NADH-quinone oxidoreductase subunit N [Acidobacteriota bacterium]